MKIYILGSNAFMKEMVETTDALISLGYDADLNSDYRKLVSGEMVHSEERAKVKIDNHYLMKNYIGILNADAVLLINLEKKGVKDYIGGNGLIELGQAYVNHKKIFLLGEIPSVGLPYIDEIIAMKPISLLGDINNIKKYI